MPHKLLYGNTYPIWATTGIIIPCVKIQEEGVCTMSIAQFCEERGITTKELFKLAYVAESGIIYGLEPPDKLHAIWLRQQCVVPLYVLRFIKHTLERETNQQLVPPT